MSNNFAQSMNIINQMKDDLNRVDDGVMVSRKKRFVEQKESLATLKLLYPSKFRKDPFRRKNQDETNSGGSVTKLPSIMKNKSNANS